MYMIMTKGAEAMNSLSNTSRKVALVVGANGVIGSNLIDYLTTLPDWDIIGLSRRGGVSTNRITYLSVDLLQQNEVSELLKPFTHITHIFYAAYQDRPTWAALVEPNLSMLMHIVESVETISPHLQHVSLMQGYKVYGAHLGAFKTPARESDASPMPPEFNMAQQQYLMRQQQGKDWTWSALRPSVVCGFSTGNPMNLAMVIAIYATLSKELQIPLRFPGKRGAYHSILEMTDAGLLAKATVWAATTPACANQAFNINNGDLFRWEDLWPKIAQYFEMETTPPLSMNLETMMQDKEELWDLIVVKYGLTSYTYAEVSSWAFGDFVFSWDYDFFADGSKARRFGFHEYVDTEAMFMNIFDDFRKRRIIA